MEGFFYIQDAKRHGNVLGEKKSGRGTRIEGYRERGDAIGSENNVGLIINDGIDQVDGRIYLYSRC